MPLVDLSNFPGTSDKLQQVTELFSRHANVFAKSDDDLGCTKAVQHRIRTTDDTPVVMPYRRIPPTQLEDVKEHLQKLLRNGCIVESRSDHASAAVLVQKRSGALRLCWDYRALNAKTIKDAHPLPRIDESMDATKRARRFSKLDPLTSRYACTLMTSTRQHLQHRLDCTSLHVCRLACVMRLRPSSG